MAERRARRGRRLRGGGSTLAAGAALSLAAIVLGVPGSDVAAPVEFAGQAPRAPASTRPSLQAAFAAESYRPGDTARLRVFDTAQAVTLRVFRVGYVRGTLRRRDVMRGLQVGAARKLGDVVPGSVVDVPLGTDWRTSLYFAQLTTPAGQVGYAPFVLAPRRLGEHRVAVVLPTQTWQAYNLRDDDGDGAADTWYASWGTDSVLLHRPYENRGVPPNYGRYDEPFLRWLDRRGPAADHLSDRELRTVSGEDLAAAYDLVVFGGHHEYVTHAGYAAVRRFRDLGGNLVFLSANNFFWQVDVHGGSMTRTNRLRALGRPEAAVVGVQYFGSRSGKGQTRPWVVRDTPAAHWVFRGTGLGPGSAFSSGGIEFDATSSASPAGVEVLAEIERPLGDGRNAQMTLYQASSGARVFAAGAFSLAASVWQPPVSRVVANLLAELSRRPRPEGPMAQRAPR